MPKYEYLTKKDLGYKPDKFEQAKFEYSPLGKVFADGLNKEDKSNKIGLLKLLKNIEDNFAKANDDNKLVNILDKYDEYKTIQNLKKELIGKNILHIDGVKKFDNIVNKWKQTKDKEIIYINDKNKVDTRDFDIHEIFREYLNENIKYEEIGSIEKNIKEAIKKYQERPVLTDKSKNIINNSIKIIKGIELIKSLIDDDNFRIPGKYYAKSLSNIDFSWINDIEGYKETAEEADEDYMKGNNDNELKLIKDFISKVNKSVINNKNKAGNELKKLKQKVTNDRLRQDLIKDLERYLFGKDIANIEPEEEYEESIAERVKKRRQSKETDRDTQRTFAPQDSSINLNDFTYGENYDELDDEDREILRNMFKKGKGLKILTKQQMFSRLPILLAQIQAGNNSKNLKNELRQLIYSLYRSKALTKTLYNNLIKVI